MLTFKTTVTDEDRAKIESRCDEDYTSGWRFRLTLCQLSFQSQYYDVLDNYYVRKLLAPEIRLTYYEDPALCVWDGSLRQIPRDFFARVLMDAIVQELPGKNWHIEIWNTREREWHQFDCNYHPTGYELVWITTGKNFKFNHVDITDDLWLHAIRFGTKQTTTLLCDYNPSARIKNGEVVSSGRSVGVSAGQIIYSPTILEGAQLMISSGGSVVQPYVASNALMNICSGACVSGGSVSGIMHVYGSAVNVAVHGSAIVHAGGSADSCTVLNGGRIDIEDHGWMYHGQIRSGASAVVSCGGNLQTVDVKSSGAVVCMSGATATALVVSSGGCAYINNGARVEVIKCAGGIIY